MFKKVLIANRGEIACRVIHACREMGIATVAVFSEADRTARHVREADEAYFIGPSTASESYLVVDKIAEVIKRSGAEAVHPGYGFLSENPSLAAACAAAGAVFIGPPVSAIESMGDKMTARKMAIEAGLPVVPGTTDPLQSPEEAAELAEEFGYPVLLKASAGGGGKGMRRVDEPKEIKSAFERARSEAKNAFGDDTVYIEKYILKPRHIEVQILADTHGNVIHLLERECTIQRRHQKVVEETPSPVILPETREKICAAGVAIAQKVGYVNAGTVEFIMDVDQNFYFLEMNTRLQVEHPITEMVTGVDLVKQQLRIAAGEKLELRQEDIRHHGHAIECRVYAEDPQNQFLPSPGLLAVYREPTGYGIRCDSGVSEGYEVSMFYDPMISKLVAWAATREEAIGKMQRAIDQYAIGGVKSTLGFFRWILGRDDFHAGDFDTNYIADRFSPEMLDERGGEERIAILAAIDAYRRETMPRTRQAGTRGGGDATQPSAWQRASWSRRD